MPKMLGVATATLLTAYLAMPAHAGDVEAKALLKSMSDYMGKQLTLSFDYDSTLEVVTKDKQKLQLANSGTVILARPNKIHAMRTGGFSNVEMFFDGKTLTIFDKGGNSYMQAEVPGTLDNLVDQLRDKYQKPVPGADLLASNVYDALMPEVTDVKDLGSGVIGGTECDHLAFRTKDVDWQIWIAHGDQPYPCRYVITSRDVDQAPQYSVQIRNWKPADKVTNADFAFNNSSNAKKVEPQGLGDTDELPKQFTTP